MRYDPTDPTITATIAALTADIARLTATIADLERRISTLERPITPPPPPITPPPHLDTLTPPPPPTPQPLAGPPGLVCIGTGYAHTWQHPATIQTWLRRGTWQTQPTTPSAGLYVASTQITHNLGHTNYRIRTITIGPGWSYSEPSQHTPTTATLYAVSTQVVSLIILWEIIQWP